MDDLAPIIGMLNHTWFGAELSPDTQQRLAALGTVQEFEAEEVILQEGEEARQMGILISGRLALQMHVPGTGTITIMSVEPGDIFGQSALLAAGQAQSSVVAIDHSMALVFEGNRIRAALHEDHALAASLYPRVLQAVNRRLKATRLQLLDLFEH